MNREKFMKALALRLYPILRADGFRGSGNTLRRVDEQVVHVFNLQASTGGSECYLNLGAHLMFLPTPGGSVPDAKSIKEYECAFRDRFDPPSGSSHGWSYGRNEDELNETIAFICDHWSNYGRAFFDRYSHFPDSFHLLVDDIDPSGVHPTELLTFARIAAHLHKNARSESLAQEALRRCPERATDLRAELSQLIHDVNSTRTKR